MNPYEAPQTEIQLLPSGAAATALTPSQQLVQAFGYCAIGGRELFRGVLGIILFFTASSLIRTFDLADVFDIRWLYVLGLYPLYAVSIGWLLNRQGFLLLSMLMESNEARYCALKSRQLSLLKVMIYVLPILIVAFAAVKMPPGGIILGLWAVLELFTIRMQSTVLHHANTQNLGTVQALSSYQWFGSASMFCFLMGASLSLTPFTNVSLSWLGPTTIQEWLYFVAWILYLLQLRAYRDCYTQLSQLVIRPEHDS